MFAGHFGVAAAVKAKTPEVPLWALIVATQWLDLVFIPLAMAGIETIDDSSGGGYGGNIIHADYTHSLLGALLLSLAVGLLARRLWGKRAGYAVGAVSFSHWLLDLIVHREDMPLLPGNWGDLPLLGFGVWRYIGLSIGLEAALLAIGFAMYVSFAFKSRKGKSKTSAYAASGALGVLLALALAQDVWGLF
ncbi:permease [Cohnella hongkongensis]|uniref:Permease n=1 Tax=Cohnella hongkongensis TaxID=178337 RepID=A0ABV9FDN0_9BACL